ncbi:hypothetical protein pb186bvf_007700 [Paramecium bursaria]
MFTKLTQFFRSLRLKNQIYAFQSLVLFIIFSLWVSLIVLAILQFTNQLASKQMTQILMRPFFNQVNTTISLTAQITERLEQFSVKVEQFNNNLFYFIKKNQVTFGYQIDTCQNSQEPLYKYTYCQQQFKTDDISDVKNFVAFQNILKPFITSKGTINLFTYSNNTYYSQTPGQYQKKFPSQLETITYIMNKYSLKYFYNNTQIDNNTYVQLYYKLSGTNIITGSTIDYNFDELNQFLNQTYIVGVKVYVLDSIGKIYLSNQKLDNNLNNNFQDPSKTGFNKTQFANILEGMKNKNLTINAFDIQNKEWVVFSRNLSIDSYTFYMFFLLDISIFENIKEQFKYQVDNFQYQILLNGGIALVCAVLISILLQQIMIRQLNRQLSLLQKCAINHISNRQHFFTNLLNKQMKQCQIQKLNNAFCDLIYQNKKNNFKIPKFLYQNMTYEYGQQNLTLSDKMILIDIKQNLEMIQ